MLQTLSRLLLSALLLLTLAQCQSPDSTKAISISKSTLFDEQSITSLPLTHDAQFIQYKESDASTQPIYRHRLARYLLKQYQIYNAEKLLAHTNKEQLSEKLSTQYHILQTHIALHKQQALLARTHLQQAIANDTENILENESYFHTLRSYLAKQQGNYYLVSKHLDLAIKHADSNTQKTAIAKLYWIELNNPNNLLLNTLKKIEDETSQGWINLRNLLHHNNNLLYEDPEHIVKTAQTWQELFPKHPANMLLAKIHTTPKSINRIGVLLPNTPQTVAISSAVQNGIYAAYYTHKTDQTSLEIINTQNNIQQAYQLTTSLDLDANIGPLLKEDIKTLEQIPLSIPTLSLNTGGNAPLNNLQNYSIATAYESKQLAEYIHSKGLSKAIVLFDNSTAHKNTFESFKHHFTNLGGVVVQYATTEGNINATVKKLMGIQSSQQRYQQVVNWAQEKARFTPLRRQDIDHLVIITSHDKARQINPILHYHFAENLPIFSFSSIRSNLTNIQTDKDLDGIIFFDHPSLSTSPEGRLGLKIQHDIYQHNTQDFMRYNRYIALGIDAYLITKLQYIWDIMPSYRIDGAGAVLYKDRMNRIQRLLEPMQYKNGRVKLIKHNYYINNQWQQVIQKSI